MKKLCTFLSFILMTGFVVLMLNGCGEGDGDTPATNKVTINEISPESPTTLVFEEKVNITYDYDVVDADGVRIWIMPYTNGNITSGYIYSSSPLFKGKGTKTVFISINSSEETVVDQLKIKIANADGSETISESFQSVEYTFVES